MNQLTNDYYYIPHQSLISIIFKIIRGVKNKVENSAFCEFCLQAEMPAFIVLLSL